MFPRIRSSAEQRIQFNAQTARCRLGLWGWRISRQPIKGRIRHLRFSAELQASRLEWGKRGNDWPSATISKHLLNNLFDCS